MLEFFGNCETIHFIIYKYLLRTEYAPGFMQNARAIIMIKVSTAAFPLGKNSKPKGQRIRTPEFPPSTFLDNQIYTANSDGLLLGEYKTERSIAKV